MNYQETIDFLYTSLPMFQRIGDAAIKKDLTNIRLLCEMLGNPQDHFPTIHIAGTNGKGSTSHMLSSIFQASGKKVGLYTSPHYVDFRERIRINGRKISEKEVIRFVDENKDDWALIQPSFFEITVAMAFEYFKRKKVDIAIIETGLGGRLDSTNIITPMLSVITNISFDHMSMLGHSLPEIAFEKAGIIKHSVPVVVGEVLKETSDVFKKKSKEENTKLFIASKLGDVIKMKENSEADHYTFVSPSLEKKFRFSCDLKGPYQVENILTVLVSCFVWNRYYPTIKLTDKTIREGISQVKKNTGMIGRWMTIRKKPLVITDAAHNLDGIQAIIPALLKINAHEKHFVLGFVSDKDVKKILALFPKDGIYYWCSPDIPRGKPEEETSREAFAIGLRGKAFNHVKSAYKAALNNAGKDDLIFVGGSSYVVGDFLSK